jgi:TPP-dependent 2-oxoacid decarboxylase
MADLQMILAAIDELPPDELEEVYRHLMQRRKPTYWLVPSENLQQILEIMRPVHEQTTHMSEDEINSIIDDALNEVRRERRA